MLDCLQEPLLLLLLLAVAPSLGVLLDGVELRKAVFSFVWVVLLEVVALLEADPVSLVCKSFSKSSVQLQSLQM